MTGVTAAALVVLGALVPADANAAAAPVPSVSEAIATPVAERETSARCRSLTARLRGLAIQESNARDAALRGRGRNQRADADVRLKRQMLGQAGCNQPMKPGDYRSRRCFELRSQLRQARQRARSRPVYGATASAKLARIRRERQEVAAQYRLSGCPGGRIGN